MNFIINGNPISSKNSIRSGITKDGRNYTYTVKAVKDYKDNALKQLTVQARDYLKDYIFDYGKTDLPIYLPIQVSFIFYCKDNRKRDLVNLCQLPCDLLQAAGIIQNDNLIKSLDGSRIMGVDKLNPRTEITIYILNGKTN